MKKELSVDSLMPFMPPSVLEEYFLHGDASILGFSPGVKQWLKTSTHPRVEHWREALKRETARQIKQALKEQKKMSDLAREYYSGQTTSIRHRAVIHPELKGRMERKHGSSVWKDPDALKDTQKRQPRLFIK